MPRVWLTLLNNLSNSFDGWLTLLKPWEKRTLRFPKTIVDCQPYLNEAIGPWISGLIKHWGHVKSYKTIQRGNTAKFHHSDVWKNEKITGLGQGQIAWMGLVPFTRQITWINFLFKLSAIPKITKYFLWLFLGSGSEKRRS